MKSTEQTIVLGGGCFWCLDAAYRLVAGVTGVTSGYAGGGGSKPTYEQVSTGLTGHAEVVQVSFDSTILSLEDVLDIFWVLHDPTTVNRQGNDRGTQYRSVIYYIDDAQKSVIERSIASVSALWDDPIVTEVAPLDVFFPAEPYHQNYFEQHPEQAYCQVIIQPKLKKLRAKFAQQLIK